MRCETTKGNDSNLHSLYKKNVLGGTSAVSNWKTDLSQDKTMPLP